MDATSVGEDRASETVVGDTFLEMHDTGVPFREVRKQSHPVLMLPVSIKLKLKSIKEHCCHDERRLRSRWGKQSEMTRNIIMIHQNPHLGEHILVGQGGVCHSLDPRFLETQITEACTI